MNISSINVYLPLQRCFLHTSCSLTNRHIGNAMKKIMGLKKRKFYYNEAPAVYNPEIFSKGNSDGKHGDSRRASVLNKLFMRHITDQMATGEYAAEILGHGIEINKVKVTADYKILRVYWLARNEDDELVEKVLQKNAGYLRHELSSLQIMGNVPKIQFVKDKQYASVSEIDNRLNKADFGEDYTPQDPSEKLKTDLELYLTLEDNLKEKIKELEKEDHDDIEEEPLPPMPQNVLGLDHAAIMTRVQKFMKKSEALHRQTNSTEEADDAWVKFKLNQSVNSDPVILGSGRTEREAFREFLQKRQVMKQKARRAKNYTPDVEYIKQELRERHMELLDTFSMENDNDEDYIEEETNRRY